MCARAPVSSQVTFCRFAPWREREHPYFPQTILRSCRVQAAHLRCCCYWHGNKTRGQRLFDGGLFAKTLSTGLLFLLVLRASADTDVPTVATFGIGHRASFILSGTFLTSVTERFSLSGYFCSLGPLPPNPRAAERDNYIGRMSRHRVILTSAALVTRPPVASPDWVPSSL